jgi:hypothetical protein
MNDRWKRDRQHSLLNGIETGLDIRESCATAITCVVHYYSERFGTFYGLLNDAVGSSVYTSSNSRMINEQLIVRDMEGSDRGII